MRTPTDSEIRALHERAAPSAAALEVVLTHCEIVCAIAERLAAERPGVDVALVRAGALLHDIGVHRLNGDSYLRHGVLGHEMLRELGFPETLCRFCSCHTGVGLTRDDIERQRLPLPPGDYVARTAEERIVMYADKFHSKTTPPAFLTADTYAAQVRRFGDDKAAQFAAMVADFGEPDLEPLAARYGHRLL